MPPAPAGTGAQAAPAPATTAPRAAPADPDPAAGHVSLAYVLEPGMLGCPDEADRDNDGVPDSRDQCPDQPEDTDGFQDTDGCPDLDNDNDGIPDAQDECIDEPENFNHFEDEDGCPDDPKAGKKKAK